MGGARWGKADVTAGGCATLFPARGLPRGDRCRVKTAIDAGDGPGSRETAHEILGNARQRHHRQLRGGRHCPGIRINTVSRPAERISSSGDAPNEAWSSCSTRQKGPLNSDREFWRGDTCRGSHAARIPNGSATPRPAAPSGSRGRRRKGNERSSTTRRDALAVNLYKRPDTSARSAARRRQGEPRLIILQTNPRRGGGSFAPHNE